MSDAFSETVSSCASPRLAHLKALEERREAAKQRYFAHTDPGGLTHSEKNAWAFEHAALYLMLAAAQRRYGAEMELVGLLEDELA